MRTKGATLGRLEGTHAEGKRVVGTVGAPKKAPTEEKTREEREIDFAVAHRCFLISVRVRIVDSFCYCDHCTFSAKACWNHSILYGHIRIENIHCNPNLIFLEKLSSREEYSLVLPF